jgi:acetyl-CoA carboxylase, biotin carboxylase subunit
LDEYKITGIRTNVSLFRRILTDPEFLRSEISTKWLDDLLSRPRPVARDTRPEAEEAAAVAAAFWKMLQASRTGEGVAPTTASRWKTDGRRQQLDRTP